MKHFLTTSISDVRLRQIMTELRLPGITHAGAFDRDAQPLFTPGEGSLVSDRAIAERLRSRLVGPNGHGSSRACSMPPMNEATRSSSACAVPP